MPQKHERRIDLIKIYLPDTVGSVCVEVVDLFTAYRMMVVLRTRILHATLLLLLLHEPDRQILHVLAATSRTKTKFSCSSSSYTKHVGENTVPSTNECLRAVVNNKLHEDHDEDIHHISYNNYEMIIRGLGSDDLCPFSFTIPISHFSPSGIYFLIDNHTKTNLKALNFGFAIIADSK